MRQRGAGAQVGGEPRDGLGPVNSYIPCIRIVHKNPDCMFIHTEYNTVENNFTASLLKSPYHQRHSSFSSIKFICSRAGQTSLAKSVTDLLSIIPLLASILPVVARIVHFCDCLLRARYWTKIRSEFPGFCGGFPRVGFFFLRPTPARFPP